MSDGSLVCLYRVAVTPCRRRVSQADIGRRCSARDVARELARAIEETQRVCALYVYADGGVEIWPLPSDAYATAFVDRAPLSLVGMYDEHAIEGQVVDDIRAMPRPSFV